MSHQQNREEGNQLELQQPYWQPVLPPHVRAILLAFSALLHIIEYIITEELAPPTTSAEAEVSTHHRLASDVEGHFIGPMPPSDFLQIFLPPSTSQIPPRPSFDKSIFRNVLAQGSQRAIYDALVCTIYLSHRPSYGVCPGKFFLSILSSSSFCLLRFKSRPDLRCLPNWDHWS
jgi:hypothetical protein